MEPKRFAVLSERPGSVGMTLTEFGIFKGYVALDFDDPKEAEEFADAAESRLGPLHVLDRRTNEVIYVSVTGRRDPKPPWP